MEEQLVVELNAIKLSIFNKSGFIDQLIIKMFSNQDISLGEILLKSIENIQKMQGVGNKKVTLFMAFQSDLINNPEKYIDFYKFRYTDLIVPTENIENISLYEKVMLSIKAYAKILHECGNKRDAELLQKYYGIDSKMYSKEQVGSLLGFISSERIRQILFIELELRNFFIGKKVMNISLNNEIVQQLKEVIEKAKFTSKFSSYLDSNSKINFAQQDKIAELFLCSLTKIDEHEILLDQDKVGRYKKQYINIIQKLKKSVFPIKLNEITNDEIIFNSVINLNHEIIQISEKNSEKYYSLHWKELSGIDYQFKRILFENDGVMSRIEIINEYNRRAALAGCEQISESQLKIKSDKYFKGQKNGYWQFRTENFENIRQFIDQFIKSKGGKITFKEVKDVVIEKGLKYPDNSIRTYITNICSISANDSNLFVHKNYIESFPEISLLNKRRVDVSNKIINLVVQFLQENNLLLNEEALYEKVKADFEKENGSIRKADYGNIVNKFLEIGILDRFETENSNKISLNESVLANYDLVNLGKKLEPGYKSKIRSFVINYLKKKENNQCYKKELWDEFHYLIPTNINRNVFYKIINDSKFFDIIGKGQKSAIKLKINLLPEPKDLSFELEIPEINAINNFDRQKTQINYDRQKYDWVALKTKLKKELKGNNYFNDFELDFGLDQFYNALNRNSSSRFGEILLQPLYDLFFYKSDYYDRDSCFFRVTFCYEPFLKVFLNDSSKLKGLVETINQFDQIKELHSFKFNFRNVVLINQDDKTKKNFSFILNSLIYYRNEVGHEIVNETLDMGISKQFKTIVDFIALYIYTSLILNTNK
jgi:hypothetical protein